MTGKKEKWKKEDVKDEMRDERNVVGQGFSLAFLLGM